MLLGYRQNVEGTMITVLLVSCYYESRWQFLGRVFTAFVCLFVHPNNRWR